MTAHLVPSRRFIGRAPCGGVIVATSRQPLPWIERICPDHRVEVVRLRPILGKPGKRECDARCTSARTKDCECQCAGANHGKAYEWAAEQASA